MPDPDGRLERDLAGFVRDLEDALGDALVGVSLYGSAATDDWVPGHSRRQHRGRRPRRVEPPPGRARRAPAALRGGAASRCRSSSTRSSSSALATPSRWRSTTSAGPIARSRARTSSPRSRSIARTSAASASTRRARSCCGCAPSYLDAAARPEDLDRLLTESLKSFLVILRHVLHLRGEQAPHGYREVLTAGERFLGPLPAFRRVLEHRQGKIRLGRADFSHYLADAERVVASVDTVHA